MKVLYAGESGCDFETLKRLMLVADEIWFTDRPSVTFEKWGTIGHDSFYRRVSTAGEAVQIGVHAPPSGPAAGLYLPYIEADLKNPAFVEACARGLRHHDQFIEKFIKPEADYAKAGTGAEVRRSLAEDARIGVEMLDIAFEPELMFDTSRPEGRAQTFKQIAVDASIQVTTALLTSTDHNLAPVANDPITTELMALRLASPYAPTEQTVAPHLGIEFAKAVIPDGALRHLSVPDVLEYRRQAKDIYQAWSIELNRIAVELQDVPFDGLDERVRRLIATELNPKISAYNTELASIRDKLFADLAGRFVMTALPALSIAHIASSAAVGIAAFASATIPRLFSHLADEKAAERRHAVSYLVDLQRRLEP